MPKQIVIEVPDWINEREIRDIVERYVELKLPDSVTKEEYIDLLKIDVDEIVEFPLDEELKTLKKLREKAKDGCQF